MTKITTWVSMLAPVGVMSLVAGEIVEEENITHPFHNVAYSFCDSFKLWNIACCD